MEELNPSGYQERARQSFPVRLRISFFFPRLCLTGDQLERAATCFVSR